MYRGIAQLVEQRSPKPRVVSSILTAPAMLCGQNRSARENKRKREISRDFSRFFDPEFFRKNTDPFCDFFRPQGSEPAKTGFSKKSETELNSRKDLNPRHGSNPFGFFCCLHGMFTSQRLQNKSLGVGRRFEPAMRPKTKTTKRLHFSSGWIRTHETEKSDCYQFVFWTSRHWCGMVCGYRRI